MSLHIDLQIASEADQLPDEAQLSAWAAAAVSDRRDSAEIAVRIVDAEEGQLLNHQWRGKDYATNVLSFPADLPPELELPLLGDLVVCAPVVAREAIEQAKPLEAHWAHMIVHGTLHLLGYDHIDDQEAEQMEALEIQVLTGLGFANPYANDE